MGKNQRIQTITGDTTITIPAGVTQLRATTYRQNTYLFGYQQGRTFIVDGYGNGYATGLQVNGELGIGSVAATSSPVAILGGLAFQRLAGGSSFPTAAGSFFGLTKTGKLYGWGQNAAGQLGNGDVLSRSSPVAVLGGLNFVQVVSALDGGSSTVALTSGGKAYAFGFNAFGNLGVGDVVVRSSPVAVLGGLAFTKIYAGYEAYFGLTSGGVLYSWGYNTNFGVLGVGDLLARSSPVAVLGGLSFNRVYTTFNNEVYGLAADGTLYAWGANIFGELGVGDTAIRSSPTLVLGGLKFRTVIPGFNGECYALTADGTLYAWGGNANGQLGLGDVVSRSSPVAVLGGLKFAKVIAGGGTNNISAVYALTRDGTAYSWGGNSNGELASGTVLSRSSPVAILGGLTFQEIFSTASSNVYGVTSSGNLYSWGYNGLGELGLGDITPRSSPVAVLGGLSAGANPFTESVMLSVIPGQTYPVKIGASQASFGTTPIGLGPVSSIVLEFFA